MNYIDKLLSLIQGYKSISTEPLETLDNLELKFELHQNEKIVATAKGRDAIIGLFKRKSDVIVFTDIAMYLIPEIGKRTNRILYKELGNYILDGLTMYGINIQFYLGSSFVDALSTLGNELEDLLPKIQKYVLENEDEAKTDREKFLDKVIREYQKGNSDLPYLKMLLLIGQEEAFTEKAYGILFDSTLSLFNRKLMKDLQKNAEELSIDTYDKMNGLFQQKIEELTKGFESVLENLDRSYYVEKREELDKSYKEYKKESTRRAYSDGKKELLKAFDKFVLQNKTVLYFLDTLDVRTLKNELLQYVNSGDKKKIVLEKTFEKKDQIMLEEFLRIRGGEYENIITDDCITDSWYLSSLHYAIICHNEKAAMKIVQNYDTMEQEKFSDAVLNAIYDYSIAAIRQDMDQLIDELKKRVPEIKELIKERDKLKRNRVKKNLAGMIMGMAANGQDKLYNREKQMAVDDDRVNEAYNKREQYRQAVNQNYEEDNRLMDDIDNVNMEIENTFAHMIEEKLKILGKCEDNPIVNILSYFMEQPELLIKYLQMPISEKTLCQINNEIYCFPNDIEKDIPELQDWKAKYILEL